MKVYRYLVDIENEYGEMYSWLGAADTPATAINTALELFKFKLLDIVSGQWPSILHVKVCRDVSATPIEEKLQ